ncbi:hypothetical protein K501DRAFT_248302 [Backusella circina FSU 941]|nr:hypothetical protein K501DRAFT_248302 [Backusella circina FSU 941]
MAYNEWSDDDLPRTHGRDKFRHERSIERDRGGFDEYDRYDRKKRTRRSPTPPEERRHKRRPSYSPPPMRGGYSGARRNVHEADSDHYIPNYDRDGYVPGPRYGNKPNSQNAQNSFGYPAMDVMNAPVMNNWSGNVGRFTVDPNQVDFLVPFKQFYEYTRRTSNRRVEDEEMQKRYAHYKEKFAARQLAQFFAANKDKEWFQEKYHPAHSAARADDIKQRRRRYLESFLVDLESGKYDHVKFDKDAQTTTGTNVDEPDEPEEPAAVGDAMDEDNVEYETRLVIKTVPPTIARDKIIEMCSKVEGFDYLALSEPGPNKKFHRIGWISFKSGTDMKKAFDQLDNQKVDDFLFHLAMNRKNMQQNRAPRIAPDISNSTERLQKDLEQAKELANAMEANILGEDVSGGGLKSVEARSQQVIEQHVPEEEEVSDNKNEEKSEDGKVDDGESTERWNLKKRLDMIIAYLRHVHMYCYYCGLECDSIEELNRKCFEPHCRTIASGTDESTDPKQVAKNERGVAQWAKNLDQKINLKINTPDDRELKRLGGRVAQR